MDVKDAMQQATVKLRANVEAGNGILAPNASEKIEVDPVLESYFDLESPDADMAKQVEDIKAFLLENGYSDEESMLKTLREMELHLGENRNPNRLDRIAQYIKLRQHARIFTKKADAMMS